MLMIERPGLYLHGRDRFDRLGSFARMRHDAGELVKDIIAEKNKFINGVLDIAKILQDRHDKTN